MGVRVRQAEVVHFIPINNRRKTEVLEAERINRGTKVQTPRADVSDLALLFPLLHLGGTAVRSIVRRNLPPRKTEYIRPCPAR